MFDPAVYPIVDVGVCAGRGVDPLALARHFLRAGIRLLQLRGKELGDGELLGLAEQIVDAASAAGASLIVNDRVDLALLAGAAGVHVGQEDLDVEAVRGLAAPPFVVGVSTHDRDQVDAALASSATYIAVGPIFDTSSKNTGYSARGLDLVRYAANRGKPVVAIGGITLDRARGVLAAGASGLAIISDLMTGDPEARVRQFLDVLR